MSLKADDQYADLRNGFEKYWLSTLRPFLQKKEDLRKKFVARFFMLTFISVFLLPFAFKGLQLLLEQTSSPNVQGFVSSGFYILIAILVFVVQTPYQAYKKTVKNDAMNCFISYFDDFKYEQEIGLNIHEMEESHIFPSADRYLADDCFKGSYQGVGLRITEQILKRIRKTGKGYHEYTIFQGIAIQLDMNKDFIGQTIVLKDAGFLNRFKGFKGFQRISLEDPHFEKLFEVYGTNQTEARFLLTPVFMERIVKLKDLYKGKSIQLSFFDNKLMLAINTKKNMFEPCAFFRTNINKARIDTVFEQFLTIFSIVDILKLSQK